MAGAESLGVDFETQSESVALPQFHPELGLFSFCESCISNDDNSLR